MKVPSPYHRVLSRSHHGGAETRRGVPSCEYRVPGRKQTQDSSTPNRLTSFAPARSGGKIGLMTRYSVLGTRNFALCLRVSVVQTRLKETFICPSPCWMREFS